jgi:hypothetical protein
MTGDNIPIKVGNAETLCQILLDELILCSGLLSTSQGVAPDRPAVVMSAVSGTTCCQARAVPNGWSRDPHIEMSRSDVACTVRDEGYPTVDELMGSYTSLAAVP